MSKMIPIGLVLSLFWLACDLPFDPGPMPTSLIRTTFEPGLNVFGVLRADGAPGSSIIHVEKALTTEQMYSQDPTIMIDNAEVYLFPGDSIAGIPFVASTDSLETGFYYHDTYQPLPGQTVQLKITAPDLPQLTARTTIPEYPCVDSTTIAYQTGQLRFTLLTDSSAAQYVVCVPISGNRSEIHLINTGNPALPVALNLPLSISPPFAVLIFAYDHNLTVYLNHSIAVIPQTFRETIRTVENGYGCFGSLALTVLMIDTDGSGKVVSVLE